MYVTGLLFCFCLQNVSPKLTHKELYVICLKINKLKICFNLLKNKESNTTEQITFSHFQRQTSIIHLVQDCARVFSCSVVPNSLRPQGQQPSRLLCPWNFSGKNTGVDCHFLLQGIFWTQGLNSASPALTGRFFTTEPPGKSLDSMHNLTNIHKLNSETLKGFSITIKNLPLGWCKDGSTYANLEMRYTTLKER